MAPSASIPFSSTSSTTEHAQLRDGLLAASLPLPASSSSSSSPTLASSMAASVVVAAEATVAAALAAAFAKATVSRLEAADELPGVGDDAGVAADGSVTAAAVDVAPPIGGAGPTAAASITGELGALEAMRIEEMEFALGRKMRSGEVGARAANGEEIAEETRWLPFIVLRRDVCNGS